MEAAIAGGVTSLACPPDTDPPLDEPGLVEMLKHRARSLQSGARLSARRADRRPQGRATHRDGRADRSRLRRLLAGRRAARRYAGAAARDAVRGDVRLPRLAAAAGRVSRRAAASRTTAKSRRGSGLPRMPAIAETIALDTIFELVRATGARVHLARLSTHEGVALVRAAKTAGLAGHLRRRRPSSCICATSTSASSTRNASLMPPLRSARDRDALRAGLADGTIDADLLRPHAGRRRRQAAAVRRSRARRDRPRTAAAADAQVGAGRQDCRCRRRWRASRRSRRACSASTPGISPSAPRPTSACSIPKAYWIVERQALQQPGQEHAVPRPRGAGQGALYAGRRAGRLRSVRRQSP